MTLRRRLALVAAGAVGLAVLLAVLVSYLVVRDQLRSQVDDALRAQADAVARGDFHALGAPLPGIPASAGGPAQYVQIVGPDGGIFLRQGGLQLPISPRVRSLARGSSGATFADVRVGESHLREYVFAVTVETEGQVTTAAVQLARPLNGVDHVLANLRLVLALLLVGGIGLAAVLGRLAARRVLVPLAEVAGAVQQIGETDDLSTRLRPHSDDEVGQLARRFNEMLARLQHSRAALDESVRAQRQLVADASHELRTPVTSLRTNIEVLLAESELGPEDRRRLLADVVEQSEELSSLVSDLIELGRGDLPAETDEEVRLDAVVAESIARARRNSPGIRIEESLAPVVVRGVPERLGRAVNNLLDNAVRYTGAEEPIEVTVDERGVQVRDHGPGLDEADLPYIFDRFFRGTAARGRQGSGLGLAIVRQVAERHGGSVAVANAEGGGAVFVLSLPALSGGEGEGEGTDAASAETRTEGAGAASAGSPGELDEPRVTGAHEAPPQEPEADGEDGDSGQQQEGALARVRAGRGDDDEGGGGRGESREQQRM